MRTILISHESLLLLVSAIACVPDIACANSRSSAFARRPKVYNAKAEIAGRCIDIVSRARFALATRKARAQSSAPIFGSILPPQVPEAW